MPTPREKGKTYRKTWLILGSILAVAVIISILGFLSSQADAVEIAFLNIEAGKVEVDKGNGWFDANDGMSLSLKDRIRTDNTGEASIILYDSAIVSLSPDTEIEIASLTNDSISISQKKGSTWNKFIGLAGLNKMEIETPTTVATVRGTEFGIDVTDDEESLMVAEGEVLFKEKDAEVFLTARKGEKLVLERIEKIQEYSKDVSAKAMHSVEERPSGIQRRELTQDDRERMIEGVIKTLKKMEVIRDKQLQQMADKRETRIEQRAEIQEVRQDMAKTISAKREEFTPEMTFKQRLELLASLETDSIKNLEARAAEGNQYAINILQATEARDPRLMERARALNDKMNDQINLIEELHQHDEAMGEVVEDAMLKEEFKDIIKPVIEAEDKRQQELLEQGIIEEAKPPLPELRKILEPEGIKPVIIKAEPIEEPKFRIVD